MTRSLLSAVAGWLTGMVGFTLHFLVTVGPSSLPGVPFLAALTGGVIFLVWLCLLWPLYRFMPFPSLLWHPVVCGLCGAVAGAAILWLSLSAMFHDWSVGHFWSLPFLYVGVLVGAVTCVVGSVLRRSDRPRPNNALQRTEAGGTSILHP